MLARVYLEADSKKLANVFEIMQRRRGITDHEKSELIIAVMQGWVLSRPCVEPKQHAQLFHMLGHMLSDHELVVDQFIHLFRLLCYGTNLGRAAFMFRAFVDYQVMRHDAAAGDVKAELAFCEQLALIQPERKKCFQLPPLYVYFRSVPREHRLHYTESLKSVNATLVKKYTNDEGRSHKHWQRERFYMHAMQRVLDGDGCQMLCVDMSDLSIVSISNDLTYNSMLYDYDFLHRIYVNPHIKITIYPTVTNLLLWMGIAAYYNDEDIFLRLMSSLSSLESLCDEVPALQYRKPLDYMVQMAEGRFHLLAQFYCYCRDHDFIEQNFYVKGFMAHLIHLERVDLFKEMFDTISTDKILSREQLTHSLWLVSEVEALWQKSVVQECAEVRKYMIDRFPWLSEIKIVLDATLDDSEVDHHCSVSKDDHFDLIDPSDLSIEEVIHYMTLCGISYFDSSQQSMLVNYFSERYEAKSLSIKELIVLASRDELDDLLGKRIIDQLQQQFSLMRRHYDELDGDEKREFLSRYVNCMAHLFYFLDVEQLSCFIFHHGDYAYNLFPPASDLSCDHIATMVDVARWQPEKKISYLYEYIIDALICADKLGEHNDGIFCLNGTACSQSILWHFYLQANTDRHAHRIEYIKLVCQRLLTDSDKIYGYRSGFGYFKKGLESYQLALLVFCLKQHHNFLLTVQDALNDLLSTMMFEFWSSVLDQNNVIDCRVIVDVLKINGITALDNVIIADEQSMKKVYLMSFLQLYLPEGVDLLLEQFVEAGFSVSNGRLVVNMIQNGRDENFIDESVVLMLLTNKGIASLTAYLQPDNALFKSFYRQADLYYQEMIESGGEDEEKEQLSAKYLMLCCCLYNRGAFPELEQLLAAPLENDMSVEQWSALGKKYYYASVIMEDQGCEHLVKIMSQHQRHCDDKIAKRLEFSGCLKASDKSKVEVKTPSSLLVESHASEEKPMLDKKGEEDAKKKSKKTIFPKHSQAKQPSLEYKNFVEMMKYKHFSERLERDIAVLMSKLERSRGDVADLSGELAILKQQSQDESAALLSELQLVKESRSRMHDELLTLQKKTASRSIIKSGQSDKKGLAGGHVKTHLDRKNKQLERQVAALTQELKIYQSGHAKDTQLIHSLRRKNARLTDDNRRLRIQCQRHSEACASHAVTIDRLNTLINEKQAALLHFIAKLQQQDYAELRLGYLEQLLFSLVNSVQLSPAPALPVAQSGFFAVDVPRFTIGDCFPRCSVTAVYDKVRYAYVDIFYSRTDEQIAAKNRAMKLIVLDVSEHDDKQVAISAKPNQAAFCNVLVRCEQCPSTHKVAVLEHGHGDGSTSYQLCVLDGEQICYDMEYQEHAEGISLVQMFALTSDVDSCVTP